MRLISYLVHQLSITQPPRWSQNVLTRSPYMLIHNTYGPAYVGTSRCFHSSGAFFKEALNVFEITSFPPYSGRAELTHTFPAHRYLHPYRAHGNIFVYVKGTAGSQSSENLLILSRCLDGSVTCCN